ncbi:hypothetical protein M3Y97_01129800 [Aphelenchoides bicaudatus]|nr:hypothetical protein M3Y97_01129800 [Aphelenchoides bicaudatus]
MHSIVLCVSVRFGGNRDFRDTSFSYRSLPCKRGDKYLVSDLKLRCSELMIEGLNEKNVARRLVISCMHNDKEFEEGVMEFIGDEGPKFMRKVFQSPEWHAYLDIQRDAKKLG